MCNSTKLIGVLSRWQLHLLLMLQEYWLLLPQRLELVQYLSPAEHGVCNRQSADYGFTPVPHFFFDRDSSFLSNTCRSFTSPKESPLHLASLLVVPTYTGVLTDGHWLEIAVEFELYCSSTSHTIPKAKHLVHPNSSPAVKLDVARIDADISSATSASPSPADVLSR